MKTRSLTTLGLAVIVVAAVAVIVMLKRPSSENTSGAPPAGTPKDARPSTTEAVQPPIKKEVVVSAPRVELVKPANGGEPIKVLAVREDQALAAVNGVAITLKDLGPMGKPAGGPKQAGKKSSGGPPQEKKANPAGAEAAAGSGTGAAMERRLSPEMYDTLLERAIERELVIQAAREQKVELNEEQKQQLEQLYNGRPDDPNKDPIIWHDPNTYNAEFDVNEAMGFMLQHNLLAKAGVAPYVTSQDVDLYYKAHMADYGSLPSDPPARAEAWQNIDVDIRTKLAPSVQSSYQRRTSEYMNQLKAAATIKKAEP